MADPVVNSSAVPASGALEAAFAALQRYREGSPRGDLLPIDDAVRRSRPGAVDRDRLEERLLGVLRADLPVEAREYAARQLVRIVTDAAAPLLGELASDPAVREAARGVLEALGSEAAAAALRGCLDRLDGASRAGVAAALGRLRDPESVGALATMLNAEDPRPAEAALFALGRIGTPAAAEALDARAVRAPVALLPVLGDALLACAESLIAAGRPDAAVPLCRRAARAPFPSHVRAAAVRIGGPAVGA